MFPTRTTVTKPSLLGALFFSALVAVMAVATSVLAQGAPPDESAPVVTPPELLEFAQAPYPPEAEAQAIAATIELGITIGVDGLVEDAIVLTPAEGQAVGLGFEQAAVEAAKRFVFTPATRDGEAIASRIRYRYVFELSPPSTDETERAAEDPPPPPMGQLQGTVLGAEKDKPLAGAEVILTNEQESVALRAQTDEKGGFFFGELAPDTYRLTITLPEYDASNTEEQVVDGEITEVTYRLAVTREPVSFGAVATIDPPPREVVRRTITREELTRVPGTRGDALRTIELLPGVARPPFGTGQIIVRGSAPGDSQVFIDGTPVALLYHFGGITSIMNSRVIDQIDFFPGNFSARYGRKMGGVIDVTTKPPADDALHGVADINIIDSSFMVETPVGEYGSISAAARRSYIDFFFENLVPSDAFNVVAAPVYYDYQVFSNWKASPRDRIQVNAYGSNDKFALIFSEPQDGDPNIRGDLELTTGFTKFFTKWNRQISNDLDQDIQLAVGTSKFDFALGEDLRFSGDFVDIDFRSEWRARLTPRVRLIGGLDVSVVPFDITFRGPQPGQSEGTADDDNRISTVPIVETVVDDVAVRPAGYLEVDLLPLDPWRLVLGMRTDYYREIRSWSVDPRLVSIWSVRDDLRIKAGVGLFSQPPEFNESDKTIGTPDLTAIRSLHSNLGVEYDADEGVTLGIEGFHKGIWDRVVSNPDEVTGGPLYVNEGLGRIYGLEVSGRVTPAGRRWFGFLSYTLSRSERKDQSTDDWRLFDYDQTHIMNASALYLLGRGWEAGATFRLATGNPLTPIISGLYNANSDVYEPIYGAVNSDRNDYFHRVDVRVEKKWTFEAWKLALYLDVQNVYNRMNPEGTLYNYDFSNSQTIGGLPMIPSLGLRGEI